MNFSSMAVVTLSLACFSNPVLAAGALIDSPVKGIYFYMTNRSSPSYAAGLAMGDCAAKYGQGCQIIRTWTTGCVAVAHAGSGSNHSGWAIKPTSGVAEYLALEQCQKYGAPCSIIISKCEK